MMHREERAQNKRTPPAIDASKKTG